MDELMAAQQRLLDIRRQQGLLDDGTRPKIPTVGQVLKEVITHPAAPAEKGGHLASTIFRSKEACTRNCEHCGRHLPPVEWEALGDKLYAPSNCPDCTPAIEAREAERKAQREREKRCERYKGAFPLAVGDLKAQTLAEFDRRPGTDRAILAAKRYLEGLPRPQPSGLLIHGDPGNGKSNLAALIALEARRHYLGVAWISAKDWFRYLGGLEALQREALIDLASDADLVVMDELGVRRPTGPQSEWLLSVVDAVYRRRGNIVVTTNHDPDALAEAISPMLNPKEPPDSLVGARILDRLAEVALFIRNEATSYRMAIAQERLRRVETADTP